MYARLPAPRCELAPAVPPWQFTRDQEFPIRGQESLTASIVLLLTMRLGGPSLSSREQAMLIGCPGAEKDRDTDPSRLHLARGRVRAS